GTGIIVGAAIKTAKLDELLVIRGVGAGGLEDVGGEFRLKRLQPGIGLSRRNRATGSLRDGRLQHRQKRRHAFGFIERGAGGGDHKDARPTVALQRTYKES